MKKCMKLAVTTVVMGCLLSFPAFAAETRAEYKEAVAPIREELKALEEEMDAVRTENKALSARFSEIRQIRKETGELIVSKDTWKKARELKARIREDPFFHGQSLHKIPADPGQGRCKGKRF